MLLSDDFKKPSDSCIYGHTITEFGFKFCSASCLRVCIPEDIHAFPCFTNLDTFTNSSPSQGLLPKSAQHERVMPPSKTRLVPVVKLDLALQRKIAASAASSGRPKHPIGIISSNACSNPGATSVARRVIGVSVQVGQMQFTRMAKGALSRAAELYGKSSRLVRG